MSELSVLEKRIEVSRRIIAGESITGPCEDPVVEQILVQELERKLPELERRVCQLKIDHEDRRK